jgi:hypothetical protein
MRRYNIVSRILLILTVIAFALAAPVLVQDKHQARVDVVQLPEDVITVLGKRILEEDLDVLWDGWWHYVNVLGEPAPLPPPPLNMPLLQQNLAHMHMLPHSPPDSILGSDSDGSTAPSSPDSGHSHPPPTVLADSDRESMELNDDAPPGSPKSGDSHSPPVGPADSESEEWYTAPSSLGSSDADAGPSSSTSNAPNAESQSENLRGADTEMRGKTKVERRIYGTASGVDSVNAAQMELRSVV